MCAAAYRQLTGSLLLLSFLGCSRPDSGPLRVQPAQASLPVFPGAEWAHVAPEKAGYSTTELEKARAKAATMPTTGLVVISGGRVVLEYGDVKDLSYIASVRKSVLAMLYGNHVVSGRVDLNKNLAALGITDHGGLSDQEKEATIDELLCARSGVYHEASNGGDDLASAPPRNSQKHGSYYLYSNWDFNALGTIFEQETSRNIYDEVEEVLAKPLQMQDFKREIHKKSGDLKKSMHPAYHMIYSTRDMARIGLLMLHKGVWNGQQVLPVGWAEKITKVVTPSSAMNPDALRNGPFGYGRLWWVFDGPKAVGPYKGAYTGIGAGGQFITVLPAIDTVVAHKVNVDKAKGRVGRAQYLELLQTILDARRPS